MRGRPTGAAPVIDTIAKNQGLLIVGATTRYFEVELDDGRLGYVLRTDAPVGEVVVGLTAAIPQ